MEEILTNENKSILVCIYIYIYIFDRLIPYSYTLTLKLHELTKNGYKSVSECELFGLFFYSYSF